MTIHITWEGVFECIGVAAVVGVATGAAYSVLIAYLFVRRMRGKK